MEAVDPGVDVAAGDEVADEDGSEDRGLFWVAGELGRGAVSMLFEAATGPITAPVDIATAPTGVIGPKDSNTTSTSALPVLGAAAGGAAAGAAAAGAAGAAADGPATSAMTIVSTRSKESLRMFIGDSFCRERRPRAARPGGYRVRRLNINRS